MANWVLVASYCLLFASPVVGGGSSLCTYPLSEIKTLVFVDSVKDTWYYFSPCGNSSFDECGTATLCVTTSRNTFWPYSDALLTRSSDGLYKISYNSSGLEMELWFLDGNFTNGTLTSVLDEQITLQTVEMTNGEKPAIVGDGTVGHASPPDVDNIALSHNSLSRMLLSSVLHTHSGSLIHSHATALPFSPKISDGGFRTILSLTASPSGSRPLNSPYLTTNLPSSPPPPRTSNTNNYVSNSTTNGPMSTTSTNGPTSTTSTNGPTSTTSTNGPTSTTSTNGPMPTNTANGPLPTNTANGPLPTNTANGPLPTNTANGPMPTNTANGPLPTNTANGSLPTNTPPVSPSVNGSSTTITPRSPSIMSSRFTPQSVHTSSSSSSNSQASSSPTSSPSTGLSCTTKIVIAVSVTFVATAVLAVIATLAVLIFCKRRAKKGSSYVQLAPTVYFDDDDE